MKLGKFVEELMWKCGLDVNDQEHQLLKEFGLEKIKEDDEALINYAVNYILKKKIEDTKAAKKVVKRKRK